MELSCTFKLILLALATVCHTICSTDALATSGLEQNLESLCSGIKKISHISTMDKLVDTTRDAKAHLSLDSKKWATGFSWTIPNTWLGDPKRPCLTHADMLYELQDILRERRNVCSKSHIDKLEDFKKKYLDRGAKLAKQFFELYANQVSIVCRQHLLKSLRMANERIISQEDYDKVTPWLTPDQDCDKIKNDGNPIELGSQESQDMHHSLFKINHQLHQDKIRCLALKTLSSVKTMEDLVQAIGFSQDMRTKETSGTESGGENGNEMFVLLVAEDVRPKIEEVLDTCGKFEQVYRHTIMPIVRLAQMGYNLEYPNLDKKYEDDLLVQNWFIITLVCDSMLSSRLADPAYHEKFANLVAKNEHGIIVVDQANDVAPQSDKVLMENFFTCPIDDELWVEAYLPSPFKRKTSSFARSVMKSFRIDNHGQNGAFKQRMSKVYSSMLKLTLISLAFAGLGSPIL